MSQTRVPEARPGGSRAPAPPSRKPSSPSLPLEVKPDIVEAHPSPAQKRHATHHAHVRLRRHGSGDDHDAEQNAKAAGCDLQPVSPPKDVGGRGKRLPWISPQNQLSCILSRYLSRSASARRYCSSRSNSSADSSTRFCWVSQSCLTLPNTGNPTVLRYHA